MLKFWNYDIVFQEIPDETTLAINLTNCPNHCAECHSKHLWEDIGTELNEDTLAQLLEPYRQVITCVCFMGGDREPEAVDRLAAHIRREQAELKTAWYSGRQMLSPKVSICNFDYIKLGPYLPECGSLKSKTTNQRLYRIDSGELVDITSHFWKSNFD